MKFKPIEILEKWLRVIWDAPEVVVVPPDAVARVLVTAVENEE